MRHSKRWYRSRRCQILSFLSVIVLLMYYWFGQDNYVVEPDLARSGDLESANIVTMPKFAEPFKRSAINTKIKLGNNKTELKDIKLVKNRVVNRETIVKFIEEKLQESLKEDKGTGCNMPKLDPFSKEITDLEKSLPKIVCPGLDWVSCYMSECKVKEAILKTTEDIKCIYQDIYYMGDQSDAKYGPQIKLSSDDIYNLEKSDHVKVQCSGKTKDKGSPASWTGFVAGFRTNSKPPKPPPGREIGLSVAILGFDSTSHSGFIRKMPKSFKVLTTELNATILNSYNILGDGTPAALFPILTGKNELEYPDVRKAKSRDTLDFMPFIFHKLADDGYRTAYFEDMPWIGTFTYRFNGFKKQPADHYLRTFFLEESNGGRRWFSSKGDRKYCVGDTPRFKLMLNVTEQFYRLEGKKFSFTFIGDITHDDFNRISASDDDTADFLKNFKEDGRLTDTMLIVMGDHGSRFSAGRNTLIGKLEERLPLLAIVLPESLKNDNYEAQLALEHNQNVLTTAHDIYATILDVMGLREHWNNYKVPGADLNRGLTLLEPIPKTRSCSEAGIESHWCACLSWKNISQTDDLYKRTANALVDYINSLTESVRTKCAERTLTSIQWVMRQEHNTGLLKFSNAKDNDGYIGRFDSKTKISKENYQIKITVGPGEGVYEASVTHFTDKDIFTVDTRDISRVNAYGDEPSCISVTHPHLNMYCYCND